MDNLFTIVPESLTIEQCNKSNPKHFNNLLVAYDFMKYNNTFPTTKDIQWNIEENKINIVTLDNDIETHLMYQVLGYDLFNQNDTLNTIVIPPYYNELPNEILDKSDQTHEKNIAVANTIVDNIHDGITDYNDTINHICAMRGVEDFMCSLNEKTGIISIIIDNELFMKIYVKCYELKDENPDEHFNHLKAE